MGKSFATTAALALVASSQTEGVSALKVSTESAVQSQHKHHHKKAGKRQHKGVTFIQTSVDANATKAAHPAPKAQVLVSTKLRPKTISISSPKKLWYQSMKLKLLTLKFPQLMVLITSNLLLSNLSERLLVTTPSTPSSRR